MTVTLGSGRETLTNSEVQQLIWDGKSVSEKTFNEPIRIGHSQAKGQIDLLDCNFLHGVIVQDISLAHDVTFNGSRFMGDCHFKRLSIPRILSFMDIDGEAATFHFNSVNVGRADTADLWLSFKNKDCIPALETDNAVIREMFRRLHNDPTTFVSYNQIREELG